jgi:hypothetical protein
LADHKQQAKERQMETMVKQILRTKEIVSSLGLPHEEALTFMAGMFAQHFLASQGSGSDGAAANTSPSVVAKLTDEQELDVEDPQVSVALGISHRTINYLADKLGLPEKTESKSVEPLGTVRTPFVVVNGWKVTATERREGRATKYSLIAERGGESQKEPQISSLPHAVNWVKKHCK